MITYILVGILLSLVGVIVIPIALLPDVSLPASIATAISTLGTYVGMIWSSAPLTFVALLTATAVIIGVESHIFSYKTIKWLYNKIPGIN